MLKGIKLEDLQSKYEYNAESGEIWSKTKKKVVGSSDSLGYKKVMWYEEGKPINLSCARLAWVLFYGEAIPEGLVIDHINGDPSDNRIVNLRLVTQKDNARNCRRKKRPAKREDQYVETGVYGVKYDKKYNCYIVWIDGKPSLSTYCYEDAKQARWDWEFKKGYHENNGF